MLARRTAPTVKRTGYSGLLPLIALALLFSSCTSAFKSPYPPRWGKLRPSPEGGCQDVSGSYDNEGKDSGFENNIGSSGMSFDWIFLPDTFYGGRSDYITLEMKPPSQLIYRGFLPNGKLNFEKSGQYECVNGGVAVKSNRIDRDWVNSLKLLEILGKETATFTFRKTVNGELAVSLEGKKTGLLCINVGCCGMPIGTMSQERERWYLFKPANRLKVQKPGLP
ncbi:hypothetical protein EPN96_11755 [bacterium]|nr:MAG: hypothetical protein EPN96_11755 [bacterium]